MNDLITQTKERFNHNASKKYLSDKYDAKLLFANQGGLWDASPDLIAFLKSAPEECILIDSQNIPIKINSKILLEKMDSIFTSVMEEYYLEYTKLSSKR